jgi:phage FluMu protein Com
MQVTNGSARARFNAPKTANRLYSRPNSTARHNCRAVRSSAGLRRGHRARAPDCYRLGRNGSNDVGVHLETTRGFPTMSTQEPRSSQFKCPHCGALYDVAIRPHSHSDYHTIVCSYCGDVMAEWHGKARHYRRRKRPRDRAQFAKKIVAVAGEIGTSKRVSRRPSVGKRSISR